MDVQQIAQPDPAREGRKDNLANRAAPPGDIDVSQTRRGREAGLQQLHHRSCEVKPRTRGYKVAKNRGTRGPVN